ncbi:MAG TPA: hypothetical protein VM891_14560 [Amaricoccus sp.]|nr:hypothetical protein [Amaricoccus sp.]
MLDDLSLQQMLFRLLAVVVVSGVHGFALAGTARLLGDPGPAQDGRLTLDPFVHLAVLGVIGGIAARMAWIRPIDIEAPLLRGKRLGLVVCVLASLAVLPLLAAGALALRPLAASIEDALLARYALLALTVLAECAVWFAIFNLLPLPPLTGGHLLAAVAPGLAAAIARRSGVVSLLLAAVLVLGGGVWFRSVLGPLEGILLR